MTLLPRYIPAAISIKHLLDHGKTANQLGSFLFLKKEIPTRLANMIKELQLLPPDLKKQKELEIYIVLTPEYEGHPRDPSLGLFSRVGKVFFIDEVKTGSNPSLLLCANSVANSPILLPKRPPSKMVILYP